MGTKEEHDERQKRDQIQRLRLHAEDRDIEIPVGIECVLCQSIYEEFARDLHEVSEVRDSVAKQAYADGWRYSTSSIFGIIGPMCGECYPKKDDSEAWDEG